jgi:hypothetical protein
MACPRRVRSATRVRRVSGGAVDAAGFADELTHGFEDLRRVFRDEADGFAIDEEFVFADGGLDGEILPRRDADELGDFEIDGSEAVEHGDEAVGVAAGDGEMGTAKGAPRRGDAEIEFFVADAAEELGVGGGTASADRGKGAPLAEQAAEFENVEGIDGCGRRDMYVPLRWMRCSHSKKSYAVRRRKRRDTLVPPAMSSPCEGSPLDFMLRPECAEFGVRRKRPWQ